MKRILFLIVVLILTGCGQEKWERNQELRTEIFMACLKALPAGPVATMYNDWDEVVSECESAAYYQSLRKVP
jgi:hypothetical protein